MTSILNRGASAEGAIKSKEDIIIGGEYKGSVTTRGKIELHVGSKFDGKIEAKKAEIQGEVKGSLKSEDSVCIKENGSFSGEMTCRILILDKSCSFNGQLALH